MTLLLLSGGIATHLLSAQTYVTIHLTDGSSNQYTLEASGALDMTTEGLLVVRENSISGAVASINTDNISKVTFSHTVSGINTVGQPTAVVYPNPTYGSTRINGLAEGRQAAQLYNANGQLLATPQVADGEVISLDNCSRGIYLLRVGTARIKIVKL